MEIYYVNLCVQSCFDRKSAPVFFQKKVLWQQAPPKKTGWKIPLLEFAEPGKNPIGEVIEIVRKENIFMIRILEFETDIEDLRTRLASEKWEEIQNFSM